MKEQSVRMFPYGGYDPFATPSAKAFSQSQSLPDRPPFAATPTPLPQQYTQGSQSLVPFMQPMIPPGAVPYPMIQGMPGMPLMPGQQYNQQGMTMPNQGTGLTFSKAMGGANQLMGLAQQMGNILSLFK